MKKVLIPVKIGCAQGYIRLGRTNLQVVVSMVLFLSIRLVDVSCSADVVELVLSSHRDQ